MLDESLSLRSVNCSNWQKSVKNIADKIWETDQSSLMWHAAFSDQDELFQLECWQKLEKSSKQDKLFQNEKKNFLLEEAIG